ncbi:MAG: hypothetical protein Q9167_006685 [Letrouitia subvulpina]
MSNEGGIAKFGSREVLQAPFAGRDGRSLSNTGAMFGPRGSSLANQGPPPGSFSSDLKTVTLPRFGTSRPELGNFLSSVSGPTDKTSTSEQRQNELRDKINKETKIKIGSENLLEALISKNAKQTKDQRMKVESELSSTNRKLVELRQLLEAEIEQSKRPTTPPRSRLSGLFQGTPLTSPPRNDDVSLKDSPAAAVESESPTYVLAEILQALEREGMQPDFYVERANSLVELFKRHPTLKYDLAWPIFGLRVQTMLLSESREVVAAGYRVTRHAIGDRRSLQTIRGLNTDELVILSLVKDSKANIEREQALKFVRAFMDVKGGTDEISSGVFRTIVSVAEHHEDRLRNMSLLTILELLVREPSLVVNAGGIAPLTDALVEGTYYGSESLANAVLYLLDKPKERAYLDSCHELAAAFTPFTDSVSIYGHEDKLKSNARLVSAILKTWPGLFALSTDGFASIRGLFYSLSYPATQARELILDVVFDVLRIKPPSWSSSFLAGRRLTTYGRVANLKAETPMSMSNANEEDDGSNISLVEHYIALVLAIMLQCGLVTALSRLIEGESHPQLRRKASLLLGEVLNMASRSLPGNFSRGLQVMPDLLANSAYGLVEGLQLPVGMIYQIDSVSRTLLRTEAASNSLLGPQKPSGAILSRPTESARPKLEYDIDEGHFRAIIMETQVLGTVNYLKWRWDLIQDIVEGPLKNPKRLSEAINATKFLKRVVTFYRPFKYRFSDIRNTKPNQRYVRIGASLVKALLQSLEGVNYLAESKLLRQLGECLAQLDRTSGLTSSSPLFSPYRVSETLTGGYFALLGAMSSNLQGLQMIERWHMVNIFYHIMDLGDRDDLIRALFGNMDFTLDSHLRVMLSKALTACSKNIRIYCTRLLHKYATSPLQSTGGNFDHTTSCEWAIRLLVTQLYDPEVEVCEVAVQILEEVCNKRSRLEYVVRCRPALDHLNEIGAPLLLRYVTLVEASLSRAFAAIQQDRPKSSADEHIKTQDYGTAPPHFYRELSRTVEGCRLLRDSGHFEDFVSIISETWNETEDMETLLKLKGCLWAIGNVGSMELGASFLDNSDVVALIVRIAEHSQVMTLRGTAFFVLGLISRSLHGMEIIVEHGWTAATDVHGRSLGNCLPQHLGALFSITSRSRLHSNRPEKIELNNHKPAVAAEEDPVRARITGLAIDLGNTVLAKRAAADLHGIKAKTPETFRSADLFRRLLTILNSHNFRLPVRRFVFDLFDRSVMRQIVLEEDTEDDGNDQASRPRTASSD